VETTSKSSSISSSLLNLPGIARFREKTGRVLRGFTQWDLSLRGVDPVLLFTVLALLSFGLLMVYSSSFVYAQEKTGDGLTFIRKQLGFAFMGLLGMFGVSRIPHRRWADWGYPLLGVSLFLLLLVLIPGVGAKVLGARRWIRLGGVNFQPAELAKVAMVIFVAKQLERKRHALERFGPGVLAHFLVPAPLFVLLLLQPDFGSTAMTVLTLFLLLFLAGVPKRFLLATTLPALFGAAGLILGSEYRRNRVLAFLDPWSDPGGKGFQILQSFVGLHNGGIFGVGLGNGKEKLFYLPEAHNDFIFSVIGEELGLLGIIGLVLVFGLFIHRGLKIGWDCWQKESDLFGFLLASGLSLLLGLQALVNMAVVLGLLPTKGLALPFVSYGGSALLVDLLAVGILLSISRQGRGPVLLSGAADSRSRVRG
jgi:cell division protein FtsW